MLNGPNPYQLACKNASLPFQIILISFRGNACLCSDDGHYIFITNLTDGIDQYRFPSLEKVQSFPHAIEINHPLQISTVILGAWIVCGGDTGFARIFDRRTGQLIQRLEHDKCEIPFSWSYSELTRALARKQVTAVAVRLPVLDV